MHNHDIAHQATSDKEQSADQFQKQAQQVTLIGMVIDVILGILKIVFGLVSHSYALIADGLHSFSDALTDILVIAITKYSRLEPDEDHPYGHERFETLGTVFLGCLLIAVAGAMAWDSVMRLLSQTSIEIPTWPALVIAAVSILAKELIFRYTFHVGTKIKSDLIIANAWHSRTDALSSIVVFIGIAGAMSGYSWLDAAAAVVVAIMIAKVGWDLSWDSIKELVDTAIPPEETEELREFIKQTPGIQNVHDLRSRHMGPDIILDVHLQVRPSISVSEGHQIGLIVTDRLKKQYSHIREVTFHIDAEDDDQNGQHATTASLPLRDEVINTLRKSWANSIDLKDDHNINLHYLNNQISVEIFIESNEDHPPHLVNTLKEQAASINWLGDLTLWYQHK
ncbi:cation diffusion facilitator family transporter [Alkalimarinus sediminis]|uniref:Cation diffusion facilitator family transporter n=1 Tax=Alkalimarinus sediminis TaxID=1632866 RepID=A0A9E8HLT0_9ALTE|nr:cation diffusion facilitator family transporter [Alkalimarinus sediminis]UZW76660.1 cation diffusion facilitator family transporter [Alkalimarinus sediminis]